MAHLRNDDQSMEFGGIISIGMMMNDLVFRIPYFQTHPYKNRKKTSVVDNASVFLGVLQCDIPPQAGMNHVVRAATEVTTFDRPATIAL
jgi:hypothetical protein